MYRMAEKMLRLTRSTVPMGCCWGAMLFIWGCTSPSVHVRQYGAMHEVLGGGAAAAGPRISLAEALDSPHAYAVGALPELEGEITVIDGRAWIARTDGVDLEVEGPTATPSEHAAMLTMASVERWEDFETDRHLAGNELEEFIADCARRRNIDLHRPFPFLIEGQATDLKIHVVNGACPMKPGARLAADQQPWRYEQQQPKDVTVVGFYAADSVGKMTHPGTSVHTHALLDDNGGAVTGHVERMAFAPGAMVRLPARTLGGGS